MRLGFHLSIGGGPHRAVEQARRTGCECGQIFSASPRTWRVRPLDPAQASAFRAAWAAAGLTPLVTHLSYLPNLAASDPTLEGKSRVALTEELLRARELQADFVVLHPGHYRDVKPEQALDRVARNIVLASENLPTAGTPRLLIETTSGQKGEIGATFAELAAIRVGVSAARPDLPLGICLDTAHVWAAGYDLASPDGLTRTLGEFAQVLGLDHLNLIHLNDSLSELGGRLDRHAPLGLGRIGASGLARLIRHRDLAHLAAIMETPRQTEEDDRENMARAKRLRGEGPNPTPHIGKYPKINN